MTLRPAKDIFRLDSQTFRSHVTQVVKQFSGPQGKVNLDTLSDFFIPAIGAGIGVGFANPSGFLLSLFVVCPISGERQAVQYLWMQSPGKRVFRAALNLFNQFESEARERKCERITSGCMVVSDIPKLRRLYGFLGYSLFSESFYKKI